MVKFIKLLRDNSNITKKKKKRQEFCWGRTAYNISTFSVVFFSYSCFFVVLPLCSLFVNDQKST